MKRKASEKTREKIRRLDQLARALRQGEAFSVTRLTTIKSLCEDPKTAARFALHLAGRTRRYVAKRARPQHLTMAEWKAHKKLIGTAVTQLESYMKRPGDKKRRALWELLAKVRAVNNEYKRKLSVSRFDPSIERLECHAGLPKACRRTVA